MLRMLPGRLLYTGGSEELRRRSAQGMLLMSQPHPQPYNVLFLCTGNSARSVMAEALLNDLGTGRFRAYSAGSHPTGRVNPFAVEQLRRAGLPTVGYRSKSWNEFARPGAPFIHFVFTVCDAAAAETCPVWPGKPMTAHWGVPDPAAVEGTDEDKLRAFDAAFVTLKQRVTLLVQLPIDTLDGLALQAHLEKIGGTTADDEHAQ